jgi:polyisoprenoid-binding protein YceI
MTQYLYRNIKSQMMKTIKIIAATLVVLTGVVLISAFSKDNGTCEKLTKDTVQNQKENQRINLFVTHGHCSTPFGGRVDNLQLITTVRSGQGNPLENMQLSFEIAPSSFVVCSGDEYTKQVKTPGLFIDETHNKMIFKSTNVYMMGIDWYQINGVLSIKGIEKDVKFFASGIRDPKESISTFLIVEGQVNLLDWGIDYDKIVFGETSSTPTKWMHLNMKIQI